jgi:collagenase/peptidase M9-like protein/K319-like protein
MTSNTKKNSSLFICTAIAATFSFNSLASEGGSVKKYEQSKYDHFAETIKQADTTKPIRFIEDANKKVRTLKASSKVKSTNAQSSNECTVDNLYTLTGDSLVNYIAGCVRDDIIQSPFFTENDKTIQLYSEANMITLANAIESRSATYSATDHQGMAELLLISRAGQFVESNSDTLTYSAAVYTAFSNAVVAFAANDNFLNTDDYNLQTLNEWASVVGNSGSFVANYDAMMSIYDMYPFEAVDSVTYNGAGVLYSLDYEFFRGIKKQDFFDKINNDSSSSSRFVRLATELYAYKDDERMGGVFQNTAKNVGRMLQFDNHKVATRAAIQTFLADWERLSPEWMSLFIFLNDSDDCTLYDSMCAADLKTEMMTHSFPNTFTFDDGNLIVHTAVGMNKAQALYHAQKQVEAQFKRKNQELDALASDNNEVLTMYVYGSRSDYEVFQPFLFGLDTENGGIYIESRGEFYTYERTTQESIYTLEELFRHEYVHYLQGRYTVEGLWGTTEMYQDSRLTWFEEGGAEFFAGSSQANGVELRKIMVQQTDWDNGDQMTINEIVHASYSGGFKFYHYAALFFNFLNETQPQTVTDLHKIVRSDDVAAFDAKVNEFVNDVQLQTDFTAYITAKIANVDSMIDFTPTQFALPEYLDTDLLSDIQTDINAVDVFSAATCSSIATTVNARFGCSGSVTGNNYADVNAKIDAGLVALDGGLNNFITMNCSIGNVTINGDTVSAPYTCKGGLRELGTDKIMNQAPVANAGADQNDVAIRETVEISGAASTDPEGDNLTYSWTQTSGDAVDNVSSTGGFDKMSLSFYPYEQHSGQALTFELTVSDGEYSSTDTVIINVEGVVANQAPVANAGDDQTVNEGDTVTLTGTATDADGDELTLTWTQTTGIAVTLTDGVFTAPDVDDVMVFEFELTADDGSTTGTDTVAITINPVTVTNTAPTANAGADQTVNEGAAVTLNGSGTDPENDALTMTWVQTGGATVTITDGKFTAPQVTSTETLTFELTVDDGELSDVDAVTITVNNVADTATPPTATKESSGGGSFGLFGLLFCSLITFRRKYLKN